MRAAEFPVVASVEVIPTRAKPADVKSIKYIQSQENISLEEVAYVVKITLEKMPPISSQGFELYLDNYRVRKYWAFRSGIYFKVYNPRFFAKHGGKQLRFSLVEQQFYDTGFRLPGAENQITARSAFLTDAAESAAGLPAQEDILGE